MRVFILITLFSLLWVCDLSSQVKNTELDTKDHRIAYAYQFILSDILTSEYALDRYYLGDYKFNYDFSYVALANAPLLKEVCVNDFNYLVKPLFTYSPLKLSDSFRHVNKNKFILPFEYQVIRSETDTGSIRQYLLENRNCLVALAVSDVYKEGESYYIFLKKFKKESWGLDVGQYIYEFTLCDRNGMISFTNVYLSVAYYPDEGRSEIMKFKLNSTCE